MIQNTVSGEVVGLEVEVPLIVELMIIGEPVPLDVVVAPVTIVDAIDAGIDIVPAVIPLILDANGGEG